MNAETPSEAKSQEASAWTDYFKVFCVVFIAFSIVWGGCSGLVDERERDREMRLQQEIESCIADEVSRQSRSDELHSWHEEDQPALRKIRLNARRSCEALHRN